MPAPAAVGGRVGARRGGGASGGEGVRGGGPALGLRGGPFESRFDMYDESMLGALLRRLVTILLVVAAAPACEKGCLAQKLSGGDSPNRPGGPAPQDLRGTDCSDGLLRCEDGRIEASQAAHVPYPCNPAKESAGCTCPWANVGTCQSGCAIEKLDVTGSPDGGEQLCRPLVPVARPVLPNEALGGVCTDIGYACIGGVVRFCEEAGRPVRSVAMCLDGCQTVLGLSVEHGDSVSPDGVVSILCRHAHAERR